MTNGEYEKEEEEEREEVVANEEEAFELAEAEEATIPTTQSLSMQLRLTEKLFQMNQKQPNKLP
jgi:hypothetical protein